MLSLAAVAVLHGCDDDEDNSPKVPSAVKTTFEQMYPNATNVRWRGIKDYIVAEFRDNGAETDAWFGESGKWYMSEIDVTYESLPTDVKTAFQASDFASWSVDDVEKLLRNEMATLYVLEVEKGSEDYNLFYSENGVLVKSELDRYDSDYHYDVIPQEMPVAISDFIKLKYPTARIAEVLREKHEGYSYEIVLLDGKTLRRAYFDSTNAWIGTETPVAVADIPAAVMQTLQGTPYGAWDIESSALWVNDTREWYRFEMGDPQSDRIERVEILTDGTLA